MIIRSKAPLRLGLAGGGSDVSPYSDIYGGLILNATINLYAYCTIEETEDNQITINAFSTRTSSCVYSMRRITTIYIEIYIICGNDETVGRKYAILSPFT